MGNDVSQAPPRHALHHLLGHPNDLSGHIDTHGPLAVARRGHDSWQVALHAHLESSGLLGRGGGEKLCSVEYEMRRVDQEHLVLVARGFTLHAVHDDRPAVSLGAGQGELRA